MKEKNKAILKYLFLTIIFIANIIVFYDIKANNSLKGSINVTIAILVISYLNLMKGYYLIAVLQTLGLCYISSKLLKYENSVLKTIFIIIIISIIVYPLLFLAKS